MNRSEMFMLLLGKKPWSDYEWAKRTGITRATFGNNRKNDGKNIKANTLEAMAKACGLELSQNNSDEGIRPNSKDAIFSLLVVNNSIQILEDEYEYSDYQRNFGGIDSERLAKVLEGEGMKIINMTKYCARRNGLAAWLANAALKTVNTFNLLVIKKV